MTGMLLGMNTVHPKKYAHGFVVLCFVVVMQSFIMNSHEVFIQIHQGCFAGTGAIVRLPQCQWSKPDGYGKISQCITTTMDSKAKTVCIFLGIYCILKRGINLSTVGMNLSLAGKTQQSCTFVFIIENTCRFCPKLLCMHQKHCRRLIYTVMIKFEESVLCCKMHISSYFLTPWIIVGILFPLKHTQTVWFCQYMRYSPSNLFTGVYP